ncbi:AAA family ATPase [Streptomyces sp. NPDC047841]|uniref:helix-turn-helix transcriptional regulator n=1 Tax=Streptomyces sp. NPDC047841 TaxID=3154708 RepID=UPI0034525159
MDLGPVPRTAAEGLVGREQELRLLRSFVDQASADGGALLLTGEPGIGKSVLLDAAADMATTAGASVLRYDGLEFLTDLGFSGLTHICEPLRSELDALSPPHRDALSAALGMSGGTAPDLLTVYGAALALVRRAARSRPVLLIVDDLEWVDPATAATLAFVARRLEGSRVAFLAGSRPGAGNAVSRAGLPQLPIGPLSEKAAAALVGTRFPLLAARDLQRVLAQAQGNPLALLELPGALGTPQRGGGTAPSEVLPVNRRLQDLYAFELAGLPTATQQLLLLAALEGNGDLSVLRAAAPDQDVLAVLAPAERAQVLRIDDRGLGRLVFRHPLVRATVVSRAAGGQRREAHRTLARALAHQPDRMAWHLAEATSDPDEEVAMLLEQAAQRVRRRGDAAGAFDALVRAADLSPGPADRSRRLVEAAYVGSEVVGELRWAAQLLVEARRADPELRGSLQAAVATAHVLLNRDGDVASAHRLLIGALTARHDRSDGGDVLLEAVRTLHRTCAVAGRPDFWTAFHTTLAQLALPLPPLVRLPGEVYADSARAAPEALAHLDAAVRDLHQESNPTWIERVGATALVVDRATGCRAALWRVVDDGRAGGAVASALNALTVLCLDDFLTGQWDECSRLAHEGIALSKAHGYELLTHQFHVGEGLVAAVRGDDDTARTRIRQIIEWAVPHGTRTIEHLAEYAATLVAVGRGDYAEAYHHATAVSPPGVLDANTPVARWVAMDLVEAAVRSGRETEARAHATAMRQAGLPAVSPRLALVTAGSAALAAPAGQRTPLFEEALSISGAERWPFDLARVRLAYGEHLRRALAVEESRTHLDAALDTFRHLGAVPWAARAARELRAAGRTTGWAATDPGAGGLTPQEHRIAQMAASGMTNKQIGEKLLVSHRTVSAHLYRIYPKLGITSRVALGDALTSLRAPSEVCSPRDGHSQSWEPSSCRSR